MLLLGAGEYLVGLTDGLEHGDGFGLFVLTLVRLLVCVHSIVGVGESLAFTCAANIGIEEQGKQCRQRILYLGGT